MTTIRVTYYHDGAGKECQDITKGAITKTKVLENCSDQFIAGLIAYSFCATGPDDSDTILKVEI